MSKEFESKVLEFIDTTQKNFDRIDSRIDSMETRMDGMDNRMDSMESRMDGMEKDMNDRFDKMQDEINERLDTLCNSVVIIENKVMTEFPALFEAFELNREMFKDYVDRNSYLSAKVEENSMRISVLEDQMKFIKNN